MTNKQIKEARVSLEVRKDTSKKRGFGIFTKAGRAFTFNGWKHDEGFTFLSEDGDLLSFSEDAIEGFTTGDAIQAKAKEPKPEGKPGPKAVKE